MHLPMGPNSLLVVHSPAEAEVHIVVDQIKILNRCCRQG